ncbi:MAG: hypothetical protein RL385_3658 [Pseudomonadota bacterium]|jgi:hypothetical protein
MLLGFVFCTGAVQFLRAESVLTFPLPRTVAPPRRRHNLALHSYGPTVVASSYDRHMSGGHHPGFVVDGQNAPRPIEKWASGFFDRKPWLEVRWREARTLEHVVLFHAGSRSSKEPTSRNYTLQCLTESGPRGILRIEGNIFDIASHTLHCPNARGLRIAWERPEWEGPIRLYEVEAWGS